MVTSPYQEGYLAQFVANGKTAWNAVEWMQKSQIKGVYISYFEGKRMRSKALPKAFMDELKSIMKVVAEDEKGIFLRVR